MSKPRTHVLALIDASTSMLGVAKGVRTGLNAYVADLAADTERDYRLSLVTFSEGYEELCVDTSLADAPRLDENNYRPEGQTAFYDAMAKMLLSFDKATTVDIDAGDKVLVIVGTDGVDNASRSYSAQQIMEKVTWREATGAWAFLHLAAGIEAANASTHAGLRNIILMPAAALARNTTYTGIGAATRAFAEGAEIGEVWRMLDGAVDKEPRNA